jgi:hypothetical protein
MFDEKTYSPIDPKVKASDIAKTYSPVRQQTDGVGLRVGKRAEFTLIAPVAPGGAKLWRERMEKAQIESDYYEARLGTVVDLRIVMINNDSQILFAATYADEFKPYVLDVIKWATPWIDHMFMGVGEGFPGLASPDAIAYLQKYIIQADLWYAANNDLTVRDVARLKRMSNGLREMLDAAS